MDAGSDTVMTKALQDALGREQSLVDAIVDEGPVSADASVLAGAVLQEQERILVELVQIILCDLVDRRGLQPFNDRPF